MSFPTLCKSDDNIVLTWKDLKVIKELVVVPNDVEKRKEKAVEDIKFFERALPALKKPRPCRMICDAVNSVAFITTGFGQQLE
jgi:predicted ATPase